MNLRQSGLATLLRCSDFCSSSQRSNVVVLPVKLAGAWYVSSQLGGRRRGGVCLRFAKWTVPNESFSQQLSENCEVTRILLGDCVRDAVPLQLQSDLLERD